MKKVKQTGIKSDQGFTMIELVIVIGIIGILSAILVPSFISMSRKSKLRADISTVKQVQMQIDLFMAQNDGKFPYDAEEGGEMPIETAELSEDAVEGLIDGDYIKKSDTVNSESKKIRVQSKNAETHYNPDLEHLQLKLEEKEFNEVQKMGESDQEWIVDTAKTGT